MLYPVLLAVNLFLAAHALICGHDGNGYRTRGNVVWFIVFCAGSIALAIRIRQ